MYSFYQELIWCKFQIHTTCEIWDTRSMYIILSYFSPFRIVTRLISQISLFLMITLQLQKGFSQACVYFPRESHYKFGNLPMTFVKIGTYADVKSLKPPKRRSQDLIKSHQTPIMEFVLRR